MIYNLTQFGEMFRALRKAKGYSYKSLSEKSNIAKNTLRNIERGKVLPNIDTLSILSDYLNVDLTTLFLSCKEHHYRQYESLRRNFEKMIADHKTENLKPYMEMTAFLLSETSVNGDEIQLNLKLEQLSYRMKGQYETFVNLSHPSALEAFTKAIRITIPEFTLETYEDYAYSYDELIILFNIVQVLCRIGFTDPYLEMYRFIYDHYTQLVETEIYLLPTLMNNMAVNYLDKGDFENALHYVDKGLAFINKEQVTIEMPALLLCKGLILYHMKKEPHFLYISSAMNLLTLSDRFDIQKVALAEMKAKYKIDYPVYVNNHNKQTH